MASAALLLAAQGCGGSRANSPAPSAPPTVPADVASAGQAQLNWYLAAVAGSEVIDDEAVQKHFSPRFLAAIPAATFRAHTEALRSRVKRLDLVHLEQTPSREKVHAITRSVSDRVFHVMLQVEEAAPYRITLLLVRPDDAPPKGPPVQSWNDAEREIRALAPRAAVLVADLGADGCVPRHAVSGEESLAVGSAYKLYVLAPWRARSKPERDRGAIRCRKMPARRRTMARRATCFRQRRR